MKHHYKSLGLPLSRHLRPGWPYFLNAGCSNSFTKLPMASPVTPPASTPSGAITKHLHNFTQFLRECQEQNQILHPTPGKQHMLSLLPHSPLLLPNLHPLLIHLHRCQYTHLGLLRSRHLYSGRPYLPNA